MSNKVEDIDDLSSSKNLLKEKINKDFKYIRCAEDSLFIQE